LVLNHRVFRNLALDNIAQGHKSRNGVETAIPITYMGRNGKQYVAVTAATQRQGNNESLHVFALP
jgi:hypothetical protein